MTTAKANRIAALGAVANSPLTETLTGVRGSGLEGTVSKRKNSAYRSAARPVGSR